MRRREFIGSLIGTAIAWPLTVRAQESKGVPRVGVLWHAGNAEEEAPFLGPLEQGLKDHTSMAERLNWNIASPMKYPKKRDDGGRWQGAISGLLAPILGAINMCCSAWSLATG